MYTPAGTPTAERAEADAVSVMDMTCVQIEERAMAACGLLTGAKRCIDVERGGVLCALPACLMMPPLLITMAKPFLHMEYLPGKIIFERSVTFYKSGRLIIK